MRSWPAPAVLRCAMAVAVIAAALGWIGHTALPAAASGGGSSSSATGSGSGSSSGSATSAGGGAGSSATTPSGPLPASLSDAPISLVGQTRWVTPGATSQFDVVVHLSGADAASDRLKVTICPRLRARLDFAASLNGTENAYCTYQQVAEVSSLPLSGADRQVVVPLYEARGAAPVPSGAYPMFYPSTENNGVYPVELELADANGVAIGHPITTYMVSAPQTAGLPKLAVSWVVPVAATPSASNIPLSGRQSTSLESEITALAAHRVPLTLSVEPSVVSRLNAAGAAGEHAVSSLAAVTAGGDELLPQTYVPIDVAGMTVAGQDSEITLQYQAGSGLLNQTLGRSPTTGAWAFTESPVQQELVTQARSQGATGLVVPGDAVNQLPVGSGLSFAQTTQLGGYPGTKVASSDSALALHFTNSGDQVLQAEQFLAELAVVDLEAPGDLQGPRGLAVLVPQGWQPNARFLDTVLAGLANNPLLQAETLQKFFATVPLAKNVGAPLSRNLVPAPAATAGSDGADITHARSLIASLSATVTTSRAELVELNQQVLEAESSALTPAQRSNALQVIADRWTKAVQNIRLAPQVSVTLTSTSADVPVTILNSGTLPASVELELSSLKLSFRPFNSTGGACREESQGAELCALRLSPGATLLKVPVETRTSGVFTLDLELSSGDGAFVLSQAHYTVRSTAVSGVAVGLMVGAAILLGAWWIRDRRHGRRPRKLIDPPLEDTDEGLPLAGEGGGDATGQIPTVAGRLPPPLLSRVPPGPRLGRRRSSAERDWAGPGDPAETRWSPAPPTRARPAPPIRDRPAPPTLPGTPPGGDRRSGTRSNGSSARPLEGTAPGAAGSGSFPSGAVSDRRSHPEASGTHEAERPVTQSGRTPPGSAPPHLSPADPASLSPADPASLWVDADPVVAEFFSTPPPTFGPAVRPSPPQGGPDEVVPGRSGSGETGPGRSGPAR